MMRARIVVLVVSVAVTQGCDTSSPTPYVPVYDPLSTDPVSSTEFCSLLARNTCAVLRPCCESSPFSFDEAKCRINSRLQCEARRQKSMELGLVYDDLQGGRCVRGAAILLPRCRTDTEDPLAADVLEACRMVFHGIARIGGRCEGKHPLECTPPRLGARVLCDGGTCVERPLQQGGEPCVNRPCDTGLVCELRVQAPLTPYCTARYHPIGAACIPSDELRTQDVPKCGAVLDRFCDEATAPPTCATLPSLGERCTATRGCRRPYRCDTDRSGELRCVEGKALGATCGDDKECQSKLCVGVGVRACVPSGFGPPIVAADEASRQPLEYLAKISAACSGIIPLGAGSLAPFTLPAEK